MKKGQVEIVIVIGIIVLAVVAIITSLQSNQPSPVPSGVGQSQQSVSNSLSTLYTSSANEVLEILESHGGYLSEEFGSNAANPSTVFLGNNIPYWVLGSVDTSPELSEVERRLEEGLESRIQDGLESLVFDKQVIFNSQSLDVDATIQKSKIDFAITLETTVEGYSIPQPTRFSIPTELGNILDFASDFASEEASNRFLEYHSLSSVYLSRQAADGEPEIPTVGFLSDCGQVVFRTPEDLSLYFKDSIGYSIAATLWWQDKPTSVSEPIVFAIPEINGNTYLDLEPSLRFPDNFQFQFFSPVIIVNGKRDYVGFPFSLPTCHFPYTQKYNLEFPVVTTVTDELTGNKFNFASQVCIEAPEFDPVLRVNSSMVPGSCEIQGAASCDDLECSANIFVTDSLGSALEGVTATFAGCFIGSTGADGMVEGPIKCDSGSFTLYHSLEYDFLSEEKTHTELENASFSLPKKPDVNVEFYEIAVGACEPTPVDDEYISVLFTSRENGLVYGVNNLDPAFSGNTSCEENNVNGCFGRFEGFTVSEKRTNLIPSGDYDLDIWISNPSAINDHPEIPGNDLPMIILEDISLPFLPANDNVTVKIYIEDTWDDNPLSGKPLDYALKCIQGGPGTTAPLLECSPDITFCSGFTCSVPVDYDDRLTDTFIHFFDGDYRKTYLGSPGGLLENCNQNTAVNLDRMVDVV